MIIIDDDGVMHKVLPIDTLDKIRAEIKRPLEIERYADTDSAKAQAIALNWCIEIIDKYRKEQEKVDDYRDRLDELEREEYYESKYRKEQE